MDGLHIGNDLVLVGALGIDADGPQTSARPGRRGDRECRPISTCRFSEPRWQLTNANMSPNELNTTLMPHSIPHGDACFAYFHNIWGIP
jgi:hypothetical protein